MKRLLVVIVLTLALSACAHKSTVNSAQAVASAHPAATQAGIDILNKGGNAFDAAVAVSASLAVVEPYGSGVGGGGFWLLHRSSDKKQVMIDGREVAPLKAHRDMYLDADGEPIKSASVDGALSAGIPGMPAALVHLSANYGNLALKDSLQPAIKLAKEGFAVNEHYHRLASFRRPVLSATKASRTIFLDQGNVPAIGKKIIQSDLANTLQLLSINGFDGFYKGKVAEQLVQGVQQAGGIWTKEDLANYRIKEREPVVIDYEGMKITSASLPSSGGLVLSIALNILEQYDIPSMDQATRIHVVVEAMRRAYRDRALYMGDSDFVDVPVNTLTKKPYALSVSKNLKLDEATPSLHLTGLNEIEGYDTTHFSVLDKEGNRVSATLSINYPFGSGFVPEGTGVLLNDEMDDFSMKPGTPNVYGLVGGAANAIEPGKRMLSSMSPTFFETNDQIGILGTPGGSRIISMVLLGILEAAEGKEPAEWVVLPRYHHQYLPDVIQHEPGALNDDVINALEKKGHILKSVGRPYGNMQAILRTKHTKAASDPRGAGVAIVE
jgi:gamma-glutamyltranspeptidase/glutathione hydrolase